MAHRHVGNVARFDAKCDADGFAFHEAGAGGLQLDGEGTGLLGAIEQGGECAEVADDGNVQRVQTCRRLAAAKFVQPRLELVALEVFAQFVHVGGTHDQIVDADGEFHVATDGGEISG